jgi:hypothetical protein
LGLIQAEASAGVDRTTLNQRYNKVLQPRAKRAKRAKRGVKQDQRIALALRRQFKDANGHGFADDKRLLCIMKRGERLVVSLAKDGQRCGIEQAVRADEL